jgi:hypothetical protein
MAFPRAADGGAAVPPILPCGQQAFDDDLCLCPFPEKGGHDNRVNDEFDVFPAGMEQAASA